jgi:hypothetical protein
MPKASEPADANINIAKFNKSAIAPTYIDCLGSSASTYYRSAVRFSHTLGFRPVEFPRTWFITGLMRRGPFPQGLKPAIFLLHIGTAEAVPFQNQVMKQLLIKPETFMQLSQMKLPR